MPPIRLVTFDALHTIITPRLPIHQQYALVFQPYLGHIEPLQIKASFKLALKQIQKERPSYTGPAGHEGWWREVIRRTAVGAGASANDVDRALPEMVPNLLKRFSSREGYRLFDDVLPTFKRLHELGVKTGLVSNTDLRILDALQDLEALHHLDPVLISEKEGVEKPEKEIFDRACDAAGFESSEVVHVGDELDCDYHGAITAGISALLLRRPGTEGEGERKEPDEDLTGVGVVAGLADVVDWVAKNNDTYA